MSIYTPYFFTLIRIPSFSGCGDDLSDKEICGGNGEMHGTHCHCDSGFVLQMMVLHVILQQILKVQILEGTLSMNLPKYKLQLV